MMYQQPAPEEPLSQGDILDDCPLDRLRVDGSTADLPLDPVRWTARVIVLTQACDLAQGKSTRALVATVQTAQYLVESGLMKGATVRDQVRRGQVYGLYFLPTAQPPIALPESVIDLRELHTLPLAVLERLVADGKRVCRVVTPYREHLAQHFAVTYMRIGLPDPYGTEP